MERPVLNHLALMRWVVAILLALLTGPVSAGEPPQRVLLVVSAESSIAGVAADTLREAYLAVPVSVSGIRLKPLMNDSDSRLSEVFLQKVMFMSRTRYERQVVGRVFRSGGVRPQVFSDATLLAEALRSSPNAITFMWEQHFAEEEGLRSLGVIWEAAPQ
jgi:hypothetical protein